MMRFLLFVLPLAAWSQSLATTAVVARPVERFSTITAEILPYQRVDVVARASGYIDKMTVDRGSAVRKGDVLAVLSAPELEAQIAEAQAKSLAIAGQAVEARARLAAARNTAGRLAAANRTAGAIAANELVLAEEAVRAAEGALEVVTLSRVAADQQVKTLRELATYLTVTAPFDGTVTERLLHPGSLAGPSAGPIVRLEQVGRLRVVIAVPEGQVSSVRPGQLIQFTVSGRPGESFSGAVLRIARVLDPKTRTMPVELDVANPSGRLAPGMYTEARWPAKSGTVTLLVPATAIASNTERTFVIRSENGLARYVNVRKGPAHGELVEVTGPLGEGDRVVTRATDEIREGTPLPAR